MIDGLLQAVPAFGPLTWILVGIVAYSLVAFWLDGQGLIPEGVHVSGPITTIHTKRGRVFLNWLAGPKRFWRAWTNVGLGATLVVMVGMFVLLLRQGQLILESPPAPSPVNEPANVLVIPGVNEFLPLSVAPEIVIGLLVGLVVHEGGHGLLCRVGDIDIDSMGLVTLAVIPIGAFVEPDEESQREANRGARARMFAAGVTNNYVVTIVAFALLLGPIVGSIALAPGAAIGGALPGSAADEAGIDGGDRIVMAGDREIANGSELDAYLAESSQRELSVTLGDGTETTVQRSLLVTRLAAGSPFDREGTAGLDVGDTITAVNGTAVRTERGFRDAVGNRTSVAITTEDGNTTTGPMGVVVRATAPDLPGVGGEPADHPLNNSAGFPSRTPFTLVSLGGQPTQTPADVTAALEGREPGESVEVVAVVEGERRTATVTLAEDYRGDGSGYLGIAPIAGGEYAGVGTSSLGVDYYPAEGFLSLLNGEGGVGVVAAGGSMLGLVLVVLLLPFIGAVGGGSYNFAGFVAANRNFYEITGPLEPLGGGVFLLANLLFWTGWINLNLAFFNCIPGYPLDGGRILRACVEAVVARLPIEDKHTATRAVTTSVGLAMLACLLLVVFGPQLLN
ncbi:site-2 protease family protein [Halolamina sp. CBA1230]|uniref:site-2 protease family protein n=1 Tax=Halolamina sp. CBA1230 TaxID=1853690 RepID=UPI0009A13CC3|nr:site-2 protease family protein [Halolamina sp. CBA1230]QKY21050.1 site-2 protease family protein [Halolamina sp. CBA1230]